VLLNASMALNRLPVGDEHRWEQRLVDVSVRVVADDPTGTSVITLEIDGNSISVGSLPAERIWAHSIAPALRAHFLPRIRIQLLET